MIPVLPGFPKTWEPHEICAPVTALDKTTSYAASLYGLSLFSAGQTLLYQDHLALNSLFP